MRKFAMYLLLALPAIGQGTPITFDFEFLPDSAGCAVPVPAYQGSDFSTCDQTWVIENFDIGKDTPYVDTQHGLTMSIGSVSNSIVWDGEYLCGNAQECGLEYTASFSKPLDRIRVDFAGVGGTDASFDSEDGLPIFFSYVLTAYAGVGGTGGILGQAVVANIPFPLGFYGMYDFPLTLELGNVGPIRSVGIAGLGEIDSSFGIRNLGRIEAIHAVPEAGALALLAAGLCGLVLRRRRQVG